MATTRPVEATLSQVPLLKKLCSLDSTIMSPDGLTRIALEKRYDEDGKYKYFIAMSQAEQKPVILPTEQHYAMRFLPNKLQVMCYTPNPAHDQVTHLFATIYDVQTHKQVARLSHNIQFGLEEIVGMKNGDFLIFTSNRLEKRDAEMKLLSSHKGTHFMGSILLLPSDNEFLITDDHQCSRWKIEASQFQKIDTLQHPDLYSYVKSSAILSDGTVVTSHANSCILANEGTLGFWRIEENQSIKFLGASKSTHPAEYIIDISDSPFFATLCNTKDGDKIQLWQRPTPDKPHEIINSININWRIHRQAPTVTANGDILTTQGELIHFPEIAAYRVRRKQEILEGLVKIAQMAIGVDDITLGYAGFFKPAKKPFGTVADMQPPTRKRKWGVD